MFQLASSLCGHLLSIAFAWRFGCTELRLHLSLSEVNLVVGRPFFHSVAGSSTCYKDTWDLFAMYSEILSLQFGISWWIIWFCCQAPPTLTHKFLIQVSFICLISPLQMWCERRTQSMMLKFVFWMCTSLFAAVYLNIQSIYFKVKKEEKYYIDLLMKVYIASLRECFVHWEPLFFAHLLLLH